jgi:tetrahydromethanopterin S-methyltransferase subunit F
MAAVIDDEVELTMDIDMDRVVADAEYRRQVIARLRRERMLAAAQSARDDDLFDAAAEED